MHVLILGGYGFIGLEAARRLIRDHSLTAVGRSLDHGAHVLPEARWIKADIANLDTPEKWSPMLEGVDVVVNASGALQDGARDNLNAVQNIAIGALISACKATAVKRFVQISAPGATIDAPTRFLRTKAIADEVLKQSGLDWVILRPGLVWGRTATGGTALVRMLSAMPLVQPLVLADARVQLVDIDDLSEAVTASVEGKVASSTDADLMESSTRTLAEVVAAVRAWHGFQKARRIDVPGFVAEAIARAADIAGWLGWRSPLRSTSLRALQSNVTGDAEVWPRVSGMPVVSFEESLKRRPATRQDRVFARTQLVLPLVVICLSAFWITSGVVALLQLSATTTIVSAVVDWPRSLVIAGALADIALGLALLWRPWARAACFGMIGLTVIYLLAGSWLTPHLWADPLGPFVKAVPAAILALGCATLLEER